MSENLILADKLDVNIKVEVMYNFTCTYIRYTKENKAIREAMCLRELFPYILEPIKKGDLFAGRISHLPIGFISQHIPYPSLGYFFFKDEVENLKTDPLIKEENIKKIKEICDFWENENTEAKIKDAYTEDILKALTKDADFTEGRPAYSLYRLAGTYIDYTKLVQKGIIGLIDEIEQRKKKAVEQNEDICLLNAMIEVLDLFKQICKYYAAYAEMQYRKDNSDKTLLKIKESLENICVCKPNTLHEAIQLIWLYSIVSGTRNYGRMDDYLGEFLVKDIENSVITEYDALKMLESLWKLIDENNIIVDGRVITGGRGRKNEFASDKFALLAMEASKQRRSVLPQLTLRFYKGMNPELMNKALELIGEGLTFPILYNDDVNITAVQKAFEISIEEAQDYVPFSCGEYVINHKSIGTPSGVINLLKVLELTINNGKDLIHNKQIGLDLGNLRSFKTFEELFEAYKTQAEFFVDALAKQEELEYKIAAKDCSFLFLSILYDDCIAKNKALLDGGVRYLGGTLECYGNTNTADSLTAIKKLVYEEKKFSPEKMMEILKSNFEGYEIERKIMINAPKYGNDDEEADEMLIKVHEHICNYTRDQRLKTDLHNYMIVIINNSFNTTLGLYTGASADGRKAATFMANANNPMGGRDISGITAMLNSILKPSPSIHAGAVQNIKLSKEMFINSPDAVKALLEAYFNNGGTQAMITVLSKEDLIRAINEPEKYKNLLVRVGGFSARFVELDKEVQQEIISRTLY